MPSAFAKPFNLHGAHLIIALKNWPNLASDWQAMQTLIGQDPDCVESAVRAVVESAAPDLKGASYTQIYFDVSLDAYVVEAYHPKLPNVSSPHRRAERVLVPPPSYRRYVLNQIYEPPPSSTDDDKPQGTWRDRPPML